MHTLASLGDLIRAEEHRRRDREAERLGGLEVDLQLELRALLAAMAKRLMGGGTHRTAW
jgi:hypothetical protein